MIIERARRWWRGPAIKGPSAEPPYPVVDLYHWQLDDGRRNFGDHLSKVVVAAAAASKGLTFDDQVKRHRRMLAIGSILHFARNGDTIWGTGINGKISLEELTARKLDIRAVRGPKTAAILRDRGFVVPEVFGDPALLVPLFFKERFPVVQKRDYIIVPNLHDLPLFTDRKRLVSPLWGWNRCVEAIVSAKLVVSTSLHGIILAEAFGIPARYLRLSETESTFKYDDYAQGTGRSSLPPASSIKQALNEAPHPPITFDAGRLLDAFPYDLWSL